MSRSHPWKWRVSRNKRFVSKGPCAFIYLMIYFSVEKLKLFLDDQHCDWTLWRHSGSLGRTSRCLTYMHKHFFSPEMSVKKALRQDYISNISQYVSQCVTQGCCSVNMCGPPQSQRQSSIKETKSCEVVCWCLPALCFSKSEGIFYQPRSFIYRIPSVLYSLLHS